MKRHLILAGSLWSYSYHKVNPDEAVSVHKKLEKNDFCSYKRNLCRKYLTNLNITGLNNRVRNPMD